ncbi:MAG: response regulator [Elusimicrobia bacterium]|nr:response regulator [Elusimicrobiota bacterium]
MRRNKEKARVVLVDDEPDFHIVMRDWLSPRYDFRAIGDPKLVVEELEALEPALVLLDIRMPDIDGLSLCRRLRSNERFAGLPIVFLTACRDDGTFLENIKAGGTALLTKPVDRGQLLSILEELIPEPATGQA